MDPNDPILDQPQVIEFDQEPCSTFSRLANQDLYFSADANSDLYDLHWPWANERYVKSIRMAIDDPRSEELMTLVTRYYPGYQETILGSEGMIISKRLAAPLGGLYDRAALWTLECQAEGDRLMRLDIAIDWGESLTQRMVDGLLVAQRNPKRAQGIYKQRNADRTCVFGNPLGRPSSYELDGEGHALLSYYVLVNGIVDVSLLLTISDVGEQVAWNGFLALRDTEREFSANVKKWDESVRTGRLWTSNPQLNRAVQAGRLECGRALQRLRTGFSPTSRETVNMPDLIDCTDAFDVTLSRNMLAHLRRVAEKSDGRLPALLPMHPKDPVPEADHELVSANSAYLTGLNDHLGRHPDKELLQTHYTAVQLCAESLVKKDWAQEDRTQENWEAESQRTQAGRSLQIAAKLAGLVNDSVNVARWTSESHILGRDTASSGDIQLSGPDQWLQTSGWHCDDDRPWGFADSQLGIRLAGSAIWSVSGIKWYDGALWVYPKRITELRWWALVDLPIDNSVITLVWDGSTLHSTNSVHSDQPVAVCDRIRVRDTDEHSFNLHFEMIQLVDEDTGASKPIEQIVDTFYPVFDRDANG